MRFTYMNTNRRQRINVCEFMFTQPRVPSSVIAMRVIVALRFLCYVGLPRSPLPYCSSWLASSYRDVNSALNPLYIAMCNSLLVENYSKLEQTVCAETKCMQEAWTNTCAISAGFVVTKDVFMVERSLMIQRFW